MKFAYDSGLDEVAYHETKHYSENKVGRKSYSTVSTERLLHCTINIARVQTITCSSGVGKALVMIRNL